MTGSMLRITIRSQRSELVRRVEVPWQFDPVLCGVKKADFPFLGHLDPHGTTVLSGYQLPTLVAEIAELDEGIAMKLGGRDFLDRFSADCMECARSRNLMWFIGD
jgi:hypothetical protein